MTTQADTTQEGYSPIKVHITGSDVHQPAPQPSYPRPCKYNVQTKTIVLTSATPYSTLLAATDDRAYALVQCFTNNVVICDSEAKANNTQNTGDTTLANPLGTLLSTGVVFPIRSSNALWVSAASYPTRISVLDCIKQES